MKNLSSIGVYPRDKLTVADRYRFIEFLLTASPATADEFPDTGNTGLFSSALDFNGTTTNYWANPPWWTPAGDHNFSTTDDDVKDWFDLGILGESNNNFLFVVDCVFNDDPATEEAFLDCGRNSTAGGWGIKLSTTGQFALEYREDEGSSLVAYGGIDLTARAGERHVLACYVDVQSATPQVKTRAWYSGGPSDVQQDDLPTPLPNVADGQIINIFGRGGGGGGNHLGQYSGITRLNRARFYHLPSEDSDSKWQEIAEEMWNHAAEHQLEATSE